MSDTLRPAAVCHVPSCTLHAGHRGSHYDSLAGMTTSAAPSARSVAHTAMRPLYYQTDRPTLSELLDAAESVGVAFAFAAELVTLRADARRWREHLATVEANDRPWTPEELRAAHEGAKP